MERAMHSDPSLLLIQPATQQKTTAAAAATAAASGVPGSIEKVEPETESISSNIGSSSRPGEVVLCCLQFLAVLLRNCVNKHVFSSSEVCVNDFTWCLSAVSLYFHDFHVCPRFRCLCFTMLAFCVHDFGVCPQLVCVSICVFHDLCVSTICVGSRFVCASAIVLASTICVCVPDLCARA